MKNTKRNKEEEEVEEPTLQEDISTPKIKVEEIIHPTATQQNLFNAWDSMESLRGNWLDLYGLDVRGHKKDEVLRMDFSDWSLIVKNKIEKYAKSGYSEIIQKIVDAIENKNYVIVCVSDDFTPLHKFKIALENKLSNDVIIIDNPIQLPSEDDFLYPEKRIGIIKRQYLQDVEIMLARRA